MISSLNNATVKATAKLRKRRERERRGAFLVEGHRAVAAALDSGAAVTALLHLPRGRRRVELLDAAGRAGAKVVECADRVMEHLTDHDHPPDVLAVVVRRPATIAKAAAGKSCVIVTAVHDPAVAGGILAAAAASGFAGAIATTTTADLFAPAAVRAAAGAHFALPVAVDASPEDAAAAVANRAVFRLGAEGTPVCSAGMRPPMALVVSGEDDAPDVFAGAPVVCVPSTSRVAAGLVARAAIAMHEALAHGARG